MEKNKDIIILNSIIENTRKSLNAFESIRIKRMNNIELSKEENNILTMIYKQYSSVLT